MNTPKSKDQNFFASESIGLPIIGNGKKVSGAKTWKQAFKLGVNYGLTKIPNLHAITGKPLDNDYGIYRTDNNVHIATVSKKYQIQQPEDSFKFVDELIEGNGGMKFEMAGYVGKGEKIFCIVKIPFEISLKRAEGDKSQCFLVFLDCFDGKTKGVLKLMTLRWACTNFTNSIVSSNGYGSFEFKHTNRMFDQMNHAKKLISGVEQNVKTLNEKFDILSNRKLTETAEKDILERIFDMTKTKKSTRKENIIESVRELYNDNDGNKFPEIKNTALCLFNSITNHFDHRAVIKMTEERQKLGLTEEIIRTESSIFGANDSFKTEALDKILKMTQNCPIIDKSIDNEISRIHDNILSQVAF